MRYTFYSLTLLEPIKLNWGRRLEDKEGQFGFKVTNSVSKAHSPSNVAGYDLL